MTLLGYQARVIDAAIWAGLLNGDLGYNDVHLKDRGYCNYTLLYIVYILYIWYMDGTRCQMINKGLLLSFNNSE